MSGQGFKKQRAMTPKGQMSGGRNGPAIMMMPDHVRATFMPNPPLKHLPPFKRHVLASDNYVTDEEDTTAPPPVPSAAPPLTTSTTTKTIPTSFPRNKRGAGLTGVSSFLHHFERTQPPERKVNPTPQSLKKEKDTKRKSDQDAKLTPLIESYREEQKQCAGEFTNGMNCYNTLFVGRLAYEVTERKLLREMEAYGPVKDLKLVTDKKAAGKSRGYAFVEYEHEEDMKRAYRAADGMRLEGRAIVVDVERGHTVPNWLPRRLGGGLGGTRLGGKDKNIFMAGRFDPSKQPVMPPPPQMMGMGPPHPHHGPPGGMGPGGPMMGPPGYGGPGRGGPPQHGHYNDRGPPPGYGGGGGRFDDRGPPPGYGGGGGGRYNDRGPPPGYHQRGRYGGGGYNDGGYGGDRKRRRSPSPPRRGRY
mmetsp:Transcript_5610/g.7064  ORF Transcript_5610/g.7064 Transcript_5610/m.7064 type:complete len:416 (+) Transcript_5610:68-1315(+)